MNSPSTIINIYIFKINSFENASAVNIGQNFLADWTNSDKRSQGYGQNYGDGSAFHSLRSFIDDKDCIDSPAFSHSAVKAP
ncbi:hypothetical protein ACFFK0_25465 [Paenibacillus chartarius]|uniref:Uncharacterized protein n=1 Tax=Paenibacillus chartarius TaxID=747481 RepID=A0ABV6DSX8_9BACL